MLDHSDAGSIAASIATPRACSFSALRAFTAWKMFSMATHRDDLAERRELAVNDRQLIGKRGANPRADRAAPYQLVTASVAVDTAVTGAVRAGVDAEHPHASEASISFSSMSKFDQTCLTSS